MTPHSIPLLKALTEAGAGSRRRIAEAIKAGKVRVNNAVVEDFKYPVNLGKNRVTIHGKPVNLKPKSAVYLIVNKPAGVITTTSDERGRRTVLDLLPEKYQNLRLYPVGRLDKDSTGLLILTNDGDLTYRLTHPKFEHEKEYLIQISGVLKQEEKRKLEKGIKLEDGMTYPVVVKEIKIPPFNYSVITHEGKKRQVRRMLANLGHQVIALKRVRLGTLKLGNLKEGAIRELNHEEVRALLSITPQ